MPSRRTRQRWAPRRHQPESLRLAHHFLDSPRPDWRVLFSRKNRDRCSRGRFLDRQFENTSDQQTRKPTTKKRAPIEHVEPQAADPKWSEHGAEFVTPHGVKAQRLRASLRDEVVAIRKWPACTAPSPIPRHAQHQSESRTRDGHRADGDFPWQGRTAPSIK